MLEVLLTRIEEADDDIPLPGYATEGSAGADIRANLPPELRQAGLALKPLDRILVPTGFRMSLPIGYEAQVRPRSGLSLHHGITMPNPPGTIDSDYRGQVAVPMINLSSEVYTIHHGDRIAQMIVAPVSRARFLLAGELAETLRGTGGFGSTGKC